jgi:hypothetical protein
VIHVNRQPALTSNLSVQSTSESEAAAASSQQTDGIESPLVRKSARRTAAAAPVSVRNKESGSAAGPVRTLRSAVRAGEIAPPLGNEAAHLCAADASKGTKRSKVTSIGNVDLPRFNVPHIEVITTYPEVTIGE